MKQILYLGVVLLALAGASCAEYLKLEDEQAYCEAYGITQWCNEEGVAFLESLPPQVLSDFKYINEYAFSDEARYSGALRVKDISVYADLSTKASVEAIYKIQNPSSNDITVEIAALESPANTKSYVDGQERNVDPLVDGLEVTFAPGEEREIKFVYTEELYGDIYGYNINLVFDNKTIDNHITPTGSFVFRMPRGIALEQCVPSGYTTKTENGRLTVSWQKTDFVPWTNPFNDLVCRWNMTGGSGAATAGGNEPAASGGDNTMLIVILLIIVLAGVFAAYKKGMLDGLLDR